MTGAWLIRVLFVAVIHSRTVHASQYHTDLLPRYDVTVEVGYSLTGEGCSVNGVNYVLNEKFNLTGSTDTKCVELQCLENEVRTTESSGCFDGENCRRGEFKYDCNRYDCTVDPIANHLESKLTITRRLKTIGKLHCMVKETEVCHEEGTLYTAEGKQCICDFNKEMCQDAQEYNGPAFMAKN